jgi:hypothetical protein
VATTVDGSVTFIIGGHPFTLAGSLGSNIVVEYHKPFDQAVNLGTLRAFIQDVDSAFGLGGDSAASAALTSGVGSLSNATSGGQLTLPGNLQEVSVRITDIVLNTATKHYGLGVAFDFTAADVSVGGADGIKLLSVGLNVDFTPKTAK